MITRTNIIVAICSFLLFTVGLDKFLFFLEPPCSLMNSISPAIWRFLGILQIIGSILILFPKLRKYVAVFFVIFTLFFSILHLLNNTYDIGGSLSMALLLALLVWNPPFLKENKNEVKV